MYKMREINSKFYQRCDSKNILGNLTLIVDNRMRNNSLTPWPYKSLFYINKQRGKRRKGEEVITNYENYEYAYLPIAH